MTSKLGKFFILIKKAKISNKLHLEQVVRRKILLNKGHTLTYT